MTPDEHEARALLAIAEILCISPEDSVTRREISIAADIWQNYGVDDFATSADLIDDLKHMAVISRRLASKSERIRRHVQMQVLLNHNGLPFSEDEPENPFADEHLQAIRLIGGLCDGLATTMKTTRGPKGDLPRRVAWLRATEIYEQKTGRSAAFSRSADQRIGGRWVDFIRAFSTYAIPDYAPEDGAIEAFYKQRARTLKAGGNPLVEAYLGG